MGSDPFFGTKGPSSLTAVFLVSASAIAYEILLMRVLSIVQWHHFAWMIISLALLGYGASGSAIALGRGCLEPRFETALRPVRSAVRRHHGRLHVRSASGCRSMPWRSSGIPGTSLAGGTVPAVHGAVFLAASVSAWPSPAGAILSTGSIFSISSGRDWAAPWWSRLLFLAASARGDRLGGAGAGWPRCLSGGAIRSRGGRLAVVQGCVAPLPALRRAGRSHRSAYVAVQGFAARRSRSSMPACWRSGRAHSAC